MCGPNRARRLGLAVDRGGYDRWVTIGKPPSDLRQGVARLANRLREHGPMEWIWSAEYGEKNGRPHIHAMIRSGWLDNRGPWLKEQCRAAGWGRPWIKAGASAGTYAAKAARYSSKEAARSYQTWRALNGSRPWHWSRGYTSGVPMRDWVRQMVPAKDPGPWRLVDARDLPGYRESRERWDASRERYASGLDFEAMASRAAELAQYGDAAALVKRELGAWEFDAAAIGRRW